jgi:tetratricopeptide (TPR) repeat protein
MSKQDKLMRDIHRLLDSQTFGSKKELEKYLEEITKNPIPSFPKESLTLKEQAQDLITEAYDKQLDEAFESAINAIRLDPDCIEAYEFLGNLELFPETAIVYFKYGVDIGRRIFANNHFKNSIGNFWMVFETRPFMRCLNSYTDCLIEMKKYHEAISIYEELIKLNPNDNQGVRDQLTLYLLKVYDFNKFRKYDKMYKDDLCAAMSFNRALFTFKTQGASSAARTQLSKAIESNKHVIPILITKNFDDEIPDTYSIGDKSEALVYCSYAHKIWHDFPDAIRWIKNNNKRESLRVVK